MAFLEHSLFVDGGGSCKLEKLLAAASSRLRERPDLLQDLPDGTYQLRCPLPDRYHPRLNRYATALSARVSRYGHLFEIRECAPSVSGGFIGSCIPASLYSTFLTTWLEHTCLQQLELFA